MLRNYLTIAFRNLIRHKMFSLINIGGLAIGIACCLLIALFVTDELSYDRFHRNADRIVLFQQFEGFAGSGSAFAPLIKSQFAQAEKVVQLINHKALIKREVQSHYETNFYFTDRTIFDVFTLPLVQGSSENVLLAPYSVVLSERMATKYFPNENPVGKTLRYGNKFTLQVTGVLKNVPENSHLQIDFLSAVSSADERLKTQLDSYWDAQALTYLLLSSGTTLADISAQLPALARQTNDQNTGVWKLAFIPLRNIYLRAKLDGPLKAPYAIENVYVFSSVALLVLLLASFNYVNLASARSLLRAKEVGVRKTMGAGRFQLFWQFIGESTLLTAITGGLAVVIVSITLPFFNEIAGRNLRLTTLLDATHLMYFIIGLIVLSLLAGSYPALVLSAFEPTQVLKNGVSKISGKAFFRQALVVVQFSVAIMMLAATWIVWQQLYYIQHKDLGYRREQILTLTFSGEVTAQQKSVFRQEIDALASVQSATLCSALPGNGSALNKLVAEYVPSGQTEVAIQQVFTDADFVNTFGIQLMEGRNFRPNNPADQNAFLINRAALTYFGWESAVGKTIGYYTYEYAPEGGYREVPIRGEIIGVVEDYHQSDLKNSIAPMMIAQQTDGVYQMAVSIQAGQIPETVSAIEQKWKTIFSGEPFEFRFLDESFDLTYRRESQTGRISGIFAMLGIFIACLGLFGLAAFTAEQRTKEIGIRKVLGASVPQIVGLLSKDFLKLVLIAFVLASPIAWYAMNKWLENFAYRIDIGVSVFLIAGASTLLIALLTVSYQAIKAALANPVNSLRSE